MPPNGYRLNMMYPQVKCIQTKKKYYIRIIHNFERQVKKHDKDDLETEDLEFDYDDFEAKELIN